MEQQAHKYVCVAYELYADNEKGIHELIEKAPVEHPFQFISNMGITLDAFEQQIMALQQGDTFDFTLPVDDAYGPYLQEHVLELDKSIFCINGRFAQETIYPGNFIPLVNADGNRFQGLVLEVKEDKVVVDLNHPLAGKDLHFRGSVVTLRDATDAEVEGMLNMMNNEGCECGCGDCEGSCHGGHCHDEENDGDDHKGQCCGHHGEKGHEGHCRGHHEGKSCCRHE